jgi:DNA-binding CsgD family transcriptional regulator
MWRSGREDALPLAEHATTLIPTKFLYGQWSMITLADCRLQLGHSAEAARIIDALLEDKAHISALLTPQALAIGCGAAVAKGKIEQAVRLRDQALAVSSAWGLASQRAHALLAACRSQLAVGDDTATATAGEAISLFASVGHRVMEGRARLDLAQALAAVGMIDRAAEEVGLARLAAERTGANLLHKQVVLEQRRLGAKLPRSSMRTSDDLMSSLSGREREVAQLAAAGAANTEIAQALFVTVRTVEAHLTRVYRKLEVRSRAALAALLAGC